MDEPIIRLRGVGRDFPAGDQVVSALKDVDLDIEAGELVAIVGASGSGKSTLMNILGCLDRPTAGSYRIAGRDTAALDPDELAELRREHFGFIFQRYHLMGDLTAVDNVEIPAVYAGRERGARRRRAIALLTRLGLADRLDHRPSQLSGGQQQRVSIARALMNGGEVILADEPTGALDSRSGQEMMALIEQLNGEGHTVIIVTHDMSVAEHARRIIEISDGVIVADRPNPNARIAASATGDQTGQPQVQATPSRDSVGAAIDRLSEAFRMAVLAMNAHRLRAFLTMLGIIIGIASVVSVVALGEGSRRQILKQISSIGTNTVDIFPGKDFGDDKAASIHTLTPADAEALATQPYVDSVTPTVSTSVTLRYRNVAVTGQVSGVGEGYFRVRDVQIAEGRIFDRADVRAQSQVVVIDDNTKNALFPDGSEPIGQVILLGAVPAKIIGVSQAKTSGLGASENLTVWVPYTTVLGRMLGQAYLRNITVRVRDEAPPDVASEAIVKLLTLRHGVKDIFAFSTDTIRKAIEATTKIMTLLIASIALISLVVGGIGVMNIMLVSVTERTREIGVRTAVGARRSDILSQFLIEAVLVCLVGGGLGVALALGLATLITKLAAGKFIMTISPASILVAFVFSTIIGVVFGFMPARNAARLDPVEALARE
jgi:macrolide transport system ATP-binding/permease protein